MATLLRSFISFVKSDKNNKNNKNNYNNNNNKPQPVYINSSIFPKEIWENIFLCDPECIILLSMCSKFMLQLSGIYIYIYQ